MSTPLKFNVEMNAGGPSSRADSRSILHFQSHPVLDTSPGNQDGSSVPAESDGRREDGRANRSIFSSSRTSHLPTPQSPSNVGVYADTRGISESPIRQGSYHSRSQLRRPSPVEPPGPASFITPDSSPIFPRKTQLSTVTPPPPRTPPQRRRHLELGPEPPATPPAPRIQSVSPSLSSSRDVTPLSTLSSPFVPRLSAGGRTPAELMTPRRSRVDSPDGSPMQIDDIFSPGPSTSKSPTPLAAPIPQRPVGGELQRIRLQLAAEQAARLHEMESRRPDYLKRFERPRSDPDLAEFDLGDGDGMNAGLGVAESPMKGRRLKLFQETSEESFEQSLLAGGYPRYGDAPAYEEPRTPPNSGRAALSRRALDWLQQSTPGQPGPSQVGDVDPAWTPSEKEVKKRKRLEAFQSHRDPGWSTRLYPVEIEGRGRMLLDQRPEAPFEQPESPVKKRSGRRKRKAAALDSPAGRKRSHVAEPTGDAEKPVRPNWVDQSFPWCMRAQEREETSRREEEEKLTWIERFLDRESDEEEEEDPPSELTAEVEVPEDDLPYRRGRGKMVPLSANPDALRASGSVRRDRVMIPSDPADARAALLSKRSVRALAMRRRQQRRRREAEESDDEEIVCVCNGQVNGGELVQCDECRTWYHLRCIGIRDISELGREEDSWYCQDCLGPVISSDPPSEPTFVPTDDKLPTDDLRDPLFFQASPSVPWGMSGGVPKTPIRGRDLTDNLSSRTSWDESSRVGPSTPESSGRSVRIYKTPTAFECIDAEDPPFDPTSTPSRGIKVQFSGPFATPKTNTWAQRNGILQTPTRHGRDSWKHSGGGLPFHLGDSGGLNAFRTVYSYDDSPVRRSRPREEKGQLAPRRLLDSPLASRSTALPHVGLLQDSPIMRMALGKDERSHKGSKVQ